MSLIEELGARLHAASADLPLAALAVAHDRLRAASALLMWVRQQSTHPLGVPELSGAIEHLEHAAHALQVTQDSVAGYLTVLGLGVDAQRPADTGERRPVEEPATVAPPEAGSVAPRLRRWWAERVAYLTDGAVEPESGVAGTTAVDLLRRVAQRS